MPMRPDHPMLHRLIDYAGLFPPASLPLDAAAANFAEYRVTEESASLGRFVVSLDKLEALGEQIANLDTVAPWPVSVLVGRDVTVGVERIVEILDRFESQWVLVESIEALAETPSDLLVPSLSGIETFYEIAPDEHAKTLIAAAGEVGVSAKIRTGGIEQDLIPSTADIVRFVRSCASHRVPFKATAGLHHPFPGEYPLTYEDDSDVARMHGFMSLALTASLIWQGLVDFKAACDLLDLPTVPQWLEESEQLEWGDGQFSLADARATRSQFFRSFGSCSFVEPLDGLKEHGLV